MLALELEQLVVDGCTTKAPAAGRPPARARWDRRKQGQKRSVAVEAGGIPLAALPAPPNHRDDGLLAATLDAATTMAAAAVGPLPETLTVPLDAGYDYQLCRQVLAECELVARSPPGVSRHQSRRAWTHYRWDSRPRRRP